MKVAAFTLIFLRSIDLKKVSNNELRIALSVVSLRQLERQMGREREKQVEKIQSTESQYQQHITKLQRQVQAVEKERNMCMVSVFLQRNADRAGLGGCSAPRSLFTRCDLFLLRRHFLTIFSCDLRLFVHMVQLRSV